MFLAQYEPKVATNFIREVRKMRPIDPYSYHCGVMDSFCEIVAAGIKPMALSHPFASPEERSEYREYVRKLGRSVWCPVGPRRTVSR